MRITKKIFILNLYSCFFFNLKNSEKIILKNYEDVFQSQYKLKNSSFPIEQIIFLSFVMTIYSRDYDILKKNIRKEA
jgi:hypothetical protein